MYWPCWHTKVITALSKSLGCTIFKILPQHVKIKSATTLLVIFLTRVYNASIIHRVFNTYLFWQFKKQCISACIVNSCHVYFAERLRTWLNIFTTRASRRDNIFSSVRVSMYACLSVSGLPWKLRDKIKWTVLSRQLCFARNSYLTADSDTKGKLWQWDVGQDENGRTEN